MKEATKEEKKKGCIYAAAFLITIPFLIWLFVGNDEPETVKTYTKEQKDSIWLADQFNPDGSHFESVQTIKGSMNNPLSFEHISTRYIDTRGEGDTALRVFTTCRGTNTFNAIVTQTYVSFIDTSGYIIGLMEWK